MMDCTAKGLAHREGAKGTKILKKKFKIGSLSPTDWNFLRA
jgi:hypothetical protein